MPNITIREEDLTSAGVTNYTTNAVYIPGYAVMGPVNTPTVCNTLEEFQAVFGTSPYVFRTTQTWASINNGDAFPNSTPDSNFAEAGDFEKSYIIASDLLRQGLPIIYERVFGGDATAWTAEIAFTGTVDEEPNVQDAMVLASSTPGLVSASIYCSLESDTVVIGTGSTGDITAVYYILTVGRTGSADLGTSDVAPVETRFTFNSQLARLYSSIIDYKELVGQTDNSGLVIFKSFKPGVTAVNTTDKEKTFNLVLPVSTDKTKDEFLVSDMYKYLSNNGTDSNTYELVGYERFVDRGEYVLKYLTSGAYPIFDYDESNSIVTDILTAAANRGDAIALIDPTPDNLPLAVLNNQSVYYKVKQYATVPRYNELGEDINTYGAVFTPYAVYSSPTADMDIELPGSFGYLVSLAVSVQNNPNWYAVAGVTRGLVPNIVSLSQNLTNAIADSYTPRDAIAINPITNIKPYGLTIWGNRTLKNNALAGDLTATSFLNVRNLVCDVKRTVFVASKRMTFEQNNDILWINFKSLITPTLEQMVQGNGLTGYQLIRQRTTKKATLKAKIVLYCVEAVEDFDITISLTDSETTISE